MTTLGLVSSHQLTWKEGEWYYRGERPTPDCRAHGFTTKVLRVLHRGQPIAVPVRKQRWLWPDGHTTHDRPPEDISWSGYSLVLVFSTVWSWVNGRQGLHRATWPWGDEAPSRRSVQRWLARLLEDALRWQQALRSVVVDALVPRLMEEQYPAGIPPPGGIARFRQNGSRVGQLTSGLALLMDRTLLPQGSSFALLSEARRRFEVLSKR